MAAPVEVPDGLPQPDRQGTGRVDPYKDVGTVYNLEDDDEEPLWTEFMTHCDCVASFNPDSKIRSLAHLPGGDFTGVASQMVRYVDQNTVVIVSNGEDVLQTELQRRARDFKTKLDEGVRGARKTPPGNLVVFYTEKGQDAARNLRPGTFALERDGRYGRIINPTLQQSQQTTSRGMPGGGESSSRGFPGGAHGKQRNETGKGGFWTMLFCCCMPLSHLGGRARRSQGLERQEKKKGGIWKRFFCCCSK